jgi:hypothetical protein
MTMPQMQILLHQGRAHDRKLVALQARAFQVAFGSSHPESSPEIRDAFVEFIDILEE